MKPWEMEPVWLTFPGSAILFPAIYTPNTQFNVIRYLISADATRLRRADADTKAFVDQFVNNKGVVTAKGQCRPEILCGDVPSLVKKLQEMDARNLNRDRIFAELPIVSFGVSPYHYNMPNGPSGYTLTLHKVRVSLPQERA